MQQQDNATTPITTTLAGAAALIKATPKVRYMIRSEPGVGKTSILYELIRATGMNGTRVDCANLDIGDTGMPIIDHETMTTRYYPNEVFMLHMRKPVIVCLDEYTKGSEPVRNMLHPMLECNDPRFANLAIADGSLIFLTGNLVTDGVGDELGAHTLQRIVEIIIEKPGAEAWLKWAANIIHPLVRAWVDQYPYCLDSYTTGHINEFNFDPSKPQQNVVSGRTLEILSRIMYSRKEINHEGAFYAAVCGAVGNPAGESFLAYVKHQDELPPFQSIVADPYNAKLPTSMGAIAVLVYGMADKITVDTCDAVLQYASRLESEWQVLLNINISKNPAAWNIASHNRTFNEWLAANQDLL
jgi:hypothetical protein